VYGSPRAWRRPVRCHRRCRHRAAADRQTLGPGGGRRGDWRSPRLTTTSMAPRPGGASSFMKLSKLSMPRRPVPGSRRSSGSGIGSQTRMRSGGMPTARPTRLSPEAASVRTAARPLTPSRFCVWGRAGGKPTRGVAEGIFGQLLPPLREL
jgi:hypothetical protein